MKECFAVPDVFQAFSIRFERLRVKAWAAQHRVSMIAIPDTALPDWRA